MIYLIYNRDDNPQLESENKLRIGGYMWKRYGFSRTKIWKINSNKER